MSKFSERLKDIRENVGWSKTKLAKEIGVSLSTYANWEYGIAEPDIKTIKLICTALGVSSDTLLDLKLKSERDSNDNSAKDEAERDMLIAFRKQTEGMSEDDKYKFQRSLNKLMDAARDLNNLGK